MVHPARLQAATRRRGSRTWRRAPPSPPGPAGRRARRAPSDTARSRLAPARSACRTDSLSFANACTVPGGARAKSPLPACGARRRRARPSSPRAHVEAVDERLVDVRAGAGIAGRERRLHRGEPTAGVRALRLQDRARLAEDDHLALAGAADDRVLGGQAAVRGRIVGVPLVAPPVPRRPQELGEPAVGRVVVEVRSAVGPGFQNVCTTSGGTSTSVPLAAATSSTARGPTPKTIVPSRMKASTWWWWTCGSGPRSPATYHDSVITICSVSARISTRLRSWSPDHLAAVVRDDRRLGHAATVEERRVP